MNTRRLGTRRSLTVATGLLLTLAAVVLPATGSSAADVASLQVVRVDGREIELLMSLDAEIDVASDAAVTGTMTVNQVTFPASSALLARQERARTAMLALDISGSMSADRLDAARVAARSFIAALPDDVAVGLITFNDTARVIQAPTTDRKRMLRQLDRLVADGDTSLYDAVLAGIETVRDGQTPHVIVLSDGSDTSSKAPLSEVVRTAQQAGVVIDVIGIAPDAEQRRVLTTVTEATGGRLLTTAGTAGLVAAFDEASRVFGPRVRLIGTVPDGVDAQGGVLTASMSVGGRIVEQAVVLPDAQSLGVVGKSVPRPAAAGTPGSASAPDDAIWPFALSGAIALAVLMSGLVIADRLRTRHDRVRARQVLDYGLDRAAGVRPAGHRQQVVAVLDARTADSAWARRTKAGLAAGEMRMSPMSWLGLRLGVTFGAAAVGLIVGLITGAIPPGIGALMAAAAGWFGTATWLRLRGSRRQRAFADELPDFLLLLASSLRAGLSFVHALETTARDGRGEVARQMRRVMHEVQVGAPLDEALTDCAERMDSEDLQWVVTALSIQQEVGGTLSDVLEAAASTIKTRWELQREVRTLSAEGRISAYVLIALPVGMWLFLYATRREYLQLLWTVPIGVVMLIGMVALIGAGIAWMRSVVRIEI